MKFTNKLVISGNKVFVEKLVSELRESVRLNVHPYNFIDADEGVSRLFEPEYFNELTRFSDIQIERMERVLESQGKSQSDIHDEIHRAMMSSYMEEHNNTLLYTEVDKTDSLSWRVLHNKNLREYAKYILNHKQYAGSSDDDTTHVIWFISSGGGAYGFIKNLIEEHYPMLDFEYSYYQNQLDPEFTGLLVYRDYAWKIDNCLDIINRDEKTWERTLSRAFDVIVIMIAGSLEAYINLMRNSYRRDEYEFYFQWTIPSIESQGIDFKRIKFLDD